MTGKSFCDEKECGSEITDKKEKVRIAQGGTGMDFCDVECFCLWYDKLRSSGKSKIKEVKKKKNPKTEEDEDYEEEGD